MENWERKRIETVQSEEPRTGRKLGMKQGMPTRPEAKLPAYRELNEGRHEGRTHSLATAREKGRGGGKKYFQRKRNNAT